jgi:RNA polymerase sigma-70 factor (ECF subfamily)
MIGLSGDEILELYKKYKQGNEGAFEMLYRALSPGLFNYCIRMVGDWHEAEDVLLETFTKFASSHLDGRGNLKAWLYRVATNACYTFFRKRKTELRNFQIMLKSVADNPGPDFVKEMRVQKMLTKLPEYQRIVVVLKFYERMSYQDIADVLCCPLGTVKSRMHQGLKKLRNIMEDRR